MSDNPTQAMDEAAGFSRQVRLLASTTILAGAVTLAAALWSLVDGLSQEAYPVGQGIPILLRSVGLLLDFAAFSVLPVLLIVAGIGAWRMKYWGRDATVVLGIVMAIRLIPAVPGMLSYAWSTIVSVWNPTPTGLELTVLLTAVNTLGLALDLGVVFAAWKYMSPDISRAFSERDTEPTWMERHKLPILALALSLALIGLTEISGIVSPWAARKVFGAYLQGVPASMFGAMSAAWLGWAAVTVFKEKVTGWRVAMAWNAFFIVSVLVTIAVGVFVPLPVIGRSLFAHPGLVQSPPVIHVISELTGLARYAVMVLYLLLVLRLFSPRDQDRLLLWFHKVCAGARDLLPEPQPGSVRSTDAGPQ